ncbi:uncharacterized protein H6S33_008863 [Morchella sextelata]|uniref:uncharacterized protein n=1 Tax=Morchella sextelata TaxID=1174677 RepID=UPI001D044500|nr:uncharacterized protein H6S33_008863 [Morchella sextelata]KAH0612483.1 hypothetical protein H6S33_008863 [Morchella sextelata]
MGANQSAGRTFPIRPRTPLRFGSVPNALPVNPSNFNTSPRPYSDRLTDESSMFSLLSQESYFNSPLMTPPLEFEDTAYPRTRSVSSLSSSSDNSNTMQPHRFTCPKQDCPYMIIGYSTSEELEEHMFAVNHYLPGPTGPEFDLDGWFSPQDIPDPYSQHPLALQRQRIVEQQQKQQQTKKSQQCNCHHCLHQVGYNDLLQYESPQPSMQIQMPPPPTIIGYHDAGFELVSWRQPEPSYKSAASPVAQKMNQAEYSSLVQSGMYMDFNQVGASGRSSFM